MPSRTAAPWQPRFRQLALRLLVAVGTCALATGVLAPPAAFAGMDPRIHWEQLETPHFVVLFDARNRALALDYARHAERSHALASPHFKDAPEKTVLVIDDSSDLANGFATGVPYPLMNVHPVLPASLDSVSEYGNWGYELVLHEYTHILTFEPAHGVTRPLRWIFGSIIRPNMTLPRWYLEGLAVYMETRLSQRGRLRSRSAMATPRALVEAGILEKEDISRINETDIPDAVGGLRPYLLGGLLWNQMVLLGGNRIVGDLNNDYSRRLPFLIDGPVKKRLGQDYAALLAVTYKGLVDRVQDQIKQVREAGELITTQLPQTGHFNHSPAISPDGGRLAYIARTHRDDNLIIVVDRPSTASFAAGKSKTVTTGLAIQRISWLPDSSSLIYDKVDTFDRYNQYSELYRTDLITRKSRRLTKGLRAREPVVSPDGRHIVFVKIDGGSSRLGRIGIDGGEAETLYTPASPGIRVAWPEFLGSGDEVIFVEKTTEGEDVFKVLSLKSGAVRDVLTNFKPVSFPRWTAKGLLFVSGKTGIDNLYLAPVNSLDKAAPISNVVTRAMTGEIDARTEDLYFSKLTAEGPRLHVAAKEAWVDQVRTPPHTALLVEEGTALNSLVGVDGNFNEPHEGTPDEGKANPSAPENMASQPYSPWPYLVPRYWMPFVYVIPGGAYASATTSASDPLGRHFYSLQASTDTLSGEPSIAGQYVNSGSRVTYSLFAADTRDYIYSANLIRHGTSLSGAGSFYLSKQSTRWRGSLGWHYLRTDLAADSSESRQGPTASVEFADVTQRGSMISPERGGSASLSYTRYLADLGSLDFESTSFLGKLYFSKWLPQRHALALRLNATVSPRLSDILLGQATSAADYGGLLLGSGFIMRGYANGSFIGKNLINAGLEYRFPVRDSYGGFGTWPLFIKRWHGAVFADTVTLDGEWFDTVSGYRRLVKVGRQFTGVGMEARADLTTFYHLPVRMTLGLYYGTDQRASLGVTPFFGFSL